jgi:hypothetical protein
MRRVCGVSAMRARTSASQACVALHRRQSVVEARLLNGPILIYGATGYTGRLIAKAAIDRERARSWPDAILIKSKGLPSPSV